MTTNDAPVKYQVYRSMTNRDCIAEQALEGELLVLLTCFPPICTVF